MKEIKLTVTESRYHSDVGKGVARLPPDIMQALGVNEGDVIEIRGRKTTGAIVLESYEDEGLNTIRIDGYTRKNAGVSIGEKVVVAKIDAKEAKSVTLAPEKPLGYRVSEEEIKPQLIGRVVTAGDIILLISRIPSFFSFSLGPIAFTVTTTSPGGIVKILETTRIITLSEPSGVVKPVTYEDIGGLKEELARVREMIELPLKHPELFDRLGIDPPKGVILYGPPGTGKTLIARAVANEAGANFYAINGPEIMSKYYGESEARLREIFEEAEKNAPSIIFIDEIDSIAPKREEVTGEVERRVVATLNTLMDGLKARGKVIVIGATNRINALDPALRRPGRFDREIEIGVPDKESRKEILQIHTRGMPLAKDVDLDYYAEITYGFVGADLAALCREAAMNALRRVLPEINLEEKTIPPEILEKLVVTKEDFDNALKVVEPSAMREVLVEVPNVRWEDIGGLEKIKQELREAVEWPLKYPESFRKVGIEPPKGILLYGPPGTGKTLLAKAVATESEANFISVKGPELLSKWVGESERGVREVFRKAKMAAPCVVFFDEIDSLVPRRGSGFGDAHVTERVISQLLTEMDGIEKLENVVVMGATNRPDLIDPALLRPGRFDRVVYVPPPDFNARLEILKIHTKKMPLAEDVNLEEIARKTEGYSGADLAAVCREAGMLVLRENIKGEKVHMRHFEQAMQIVKPSITPEIIRAYETFQDRYTRRTAGEATGMHY